MGTAEEKGGGMTPWQTIVIGMCGGLAAVCAAAALMLTWRILAAHQERIEALEGEFEEDGAAK
jgi:hypothetical protein